MTPDAPDGLIPTRPSLPAVCFIVPALNEEDNLRGTVEEIRHAAAILSDHEIVIVNDGSSDQTGSIADALAAQDSRIRAVHNPRNLGLGAAYRAGVGVARMPYVIMIPGDNNHPAEGIMPILACAGKADIIIPYVANTQVRSLPRQVVSRLFVTAVNILFGLNVRYYNGLVLHRLSLLQTIAIKTDGFAYQAEALVRLLSGGASYFEMPVLIAEHGDRNTRAFRFRNVVQVSKALIGLFVDIRLRGSLR